VELIAIFERTASIAADGSHVLGILLLRMNAESKRGCSLQLLPLSPEPLTGLSQPGRAANLLSNYTAHSCLPACLQRTGVIS